MIVEFFGLPGSGKSSTAKALELSGAGIIAPIDTKRELAKHTLELCFRHPLICIFLFLKIKKAASSFKIRRSLMINAFGYRLARVAHARETKRELAKKDKKETLIIIDEGPLQNVLSLFDKPVAQEEIITCATILRPLHEHFVCFDISHDEFIKRTKDRGRVSREEFGVVNKDEWIEVLYKNYRTFMDVLPNLGFSYTIIREGSSIDEVTKKLNEIKR